MKIDPSKFTRVEIINNVNSKTDYNREYVKYLPEGAEIDIQVQDEGRTLKIFVQKRTEWQIEAKMIREAYGDIDSQHIEFFTKTLP